MRTFFHRERSPLWCVAVTLLLAGAAGAQDSPVEAAVHFENKLRAWDGFGVNYVEAC